MDHQQSHQDGAGRASRNAKGQGGNDCASDGRVVGGLRRDHALDVALSEGISVRLAALGRAVGQHTGGAAARSGSNPQKDAQRRAAQCNLPVPENRLGSVHHIAGKLGVSRDCPGAFRQTDRLGKPEQADHDRHEFHAVGHVDAAEGKPVKAGNGVVANGRQRQPEESAENTLGQRLLGGRRDDTKPHHCHHKLLRRAEVQDDLRHQRRQKRQAQAGEESAHRRGKQGCTQRFIAFSLLRHRIAVKAGRRVGRCSRDPQQHRGNGAAVHSALIDTCRKNQRLRSIHSKGKRNDQRNARCSTQARKRTDDNACQCADQHQHQIHGVEGA